jgi:hypothetical protein
VENGGREGGRERGREMGICIMTSSSGERSRLEEWAGGLSREKRLED